MTNFTCGRRALRVLLPLMLLAAAGCTNTTISGTVYNIQGEPLPGVAVKIAGTDREALTNGLGQFSLWTPPGQYQLSFRKTGYTPGACDAWTAGSKPLQGCDARLWRLPSTKGVFFYENHRYRTTKPIQVEHFTTAAQEDMYGSTKLSDDARQAVSTIDPGPVLMCCSLPGDGLRLSILEKRPVTLEGTRGDNSVDIWVPTKTQEAGLVTIDNPEGILRQVQFQQPLVPGVYALDWGALNGDTSRESRMFVFAYDGEAPSPVEDAQPAESSPSVTDKAKNKNKNKNKDKAKDEKKYDKTDSEASTAPLPADTEAAPVNVEIAPLDVPLEEDTGDEGLAG